MKQNSLAGHSNNVTNFEKLITVCTSFNGDYNPSSPIISIEGLQNKHKTASDASNASNLVEPMLKNTIAKRKEEFAVINKLITRVNNAFIASIVSATAIENARSLLRKIRGQRATPKKTEEEKAAALKEGNQVVEHSSAQTSFDNKVDNIDKYIKYLSTFPEYKPNEQELTIESLNVLCIGLKAKNMAVITVGANAKAARIKRDQELYNENDGVVAIANKVKAYVKSIYGATSPQYRQISKLKFNNH